MTISISLLRRVAGALTLLGLAGCGAVTPFTAISTALSAGATCYFDCGKISFGGSSDTVVEVAIVGSASLNRDPDADAQPEPVVIRIYELSNTRKFLAADFFALYDDGAKTLGDALVSAQEFELRPGETLQFKDEKVSDKALFIGAIAAFRDIAGSGWRLSIPIKAHDSNKFAIGADKETITVLPSTALAVPAAS
ncbi:MAG TPA: type VI secretion system lipoprotein TssJ [Stellaceae bacterium]|nr:type VI secretion system lipoprotein TssJ [Stellaceae bacterium]